MLIDDKLTWSAHIENVCSSLSSKISLLRQLAKYVSVNVLKKFYQGYILPLIDYGSITWSGTTTGNIERILKLQKRAARIILQTDYSTPSSEMFYQGYILPLIDYGSITWSGTTTEYIERILKLQKRAARIILQTDYSTPSSEMFAELGWQPINKRLAYNKAVFTYKALNGQTPQYISELLKPVAETHDRNLRSSSNGNLAVPRSRTSVFDRSFSVSAPRLWNSLQIDIRNSTTLKGFKNSLRNVF